MNEQINLNPRCESADIFGSLILSVLLYFAAKYYTTVKHLQTFKYSIPKILLS